MPFAKDQYFMVNKAWVEKVVELAELKPSDIILEIGAGLGNLTQAMVSRVSLLYAFERDPRLAELLQRKFGREEKIKVLPYDALKYPWPSVTKIVANLPYSISRDFVIKFFSSSIPYAFVVVQREFAKKLVAKVNTSNYRFVSAYTQSLGEVEFLLDIPSDAFEPKAPVASTLIKIKHKYHSNNHVDKEKYRIFLLKLFSHRQKKIRNILPKGLTPPKFEHYRPPQLTTYELLELYNHLRRTELLDIL